MNTQVLPFWNSIEKCGLPAIVHPKRSGTDSEVVLLTGGSHEGSCALGRLVQYGHADDPKLAWQVVDDYMYLIHQFTHWAYIPNVPKKEK